MTISEKIKTINNKIEQNGTQYDLDRQTVKISALSSRNANKYEFLTGKDVLPEQELVEKAATMKRFKHLPLGKESKVQTDIAKKQYQTLYKIYEIDETINKKPTPTGHILDLYCFRLSNAVPFGKNYAKFYFDAKHLEKGLNRGGRGGIFGALLSKKCPFFIKSALSGQYQMLP